MGSSTEAILSEIKCLRINAFGVKIKLKTQKALGVVKGTPACTSGVPVTFLCCNKTPGQRQLIEEFIWAYSSKEIRVHVAGNGYSRQQKWQ